LFKPPLPGFLQTHPLKVHDVRDRVPVYIIKPIALPSDPVLMIFVNCILVNVTEPLPIVPPINLEFVNVIAPKF
jgi:hypothetical protein